MQAQHVEPQQFVNKYFNKYEKLLKNSDKIDQTNLSHISQKIEEQIHRGNINIRQNSQASQKSIRKLSRIIESKAEKFNKDLLLLNMSLNRSLYIREKSAESRPNRAKSSRSELNRRSQTEVSEEDLEQYKRRKISSENRLKTLKKQKEELIKKKSLIALKKFQRERRETQNAQSQQKQKQQQEHNKKLVSITQRLKKLQQSRLSRIDTLKNSYVRSAATLPKYKIMRYRFDCKEVEHEVEERKRLKAIRLRQEYECAPQNISRHQRQYNQKVKSRKNIFQEKQHGPQYLQKREAEFNLIKHNPQKVDENLKNKLKVKNFESKINEIRNFMPKDPKIGKQIQIAKDKSKHPFKYHYLKKKKNLSDSQIFENYSNFNFDSDPIQMGNFYLEQINKKNSQMIKNSSRRARTDTSTTQSKAQYKNYLEESKRNASKKKQDQIQQLMKKYGSKSKVIEILQSRAQEHTNSTLKKINKLKNLGIGSYTNALKIQQQIDDEFISSIKAKLRCFQVK